jgi:hypothetical protein
MRTTRLVAGWSAIVLASGLGAGCATGSGARYASDGLSPTADENRALRDSAKAQAVADEVGPHVTVSADFDYASGARRVEATFHMYDDAYVIVGHLDAAGRLSIVFPNAPGDDGFVRGDKIYHVPSFFAGFNDEYQWRYSNYNYQSHNLGARHDSYDAGLGYVFVVASWRPMRLDRVTNGNRWETYEVSDVNYMSDPREAIEELGTLIAGDNREAYTIEYAHYTSTNYGTYAFSDFDRYNGACASSASWPFAGFGFFSPFGYSPFGAFGYNSSGCGSSFGYYPGFYAFGGYPTYAPGTQAPPIVAPRRPRVPIGSPIFRLPENGTGTIAMHQPNATAPGERGSAGNVGVNGSQYRRPGLIAEDAGGPRRPGERQSPGGDMSLGSHRPAIQDMVGPRVSEPGVRGDRGALWGQQRGVQNGGGTRSVEGASRWTGGSNARPSGENGRTYGGEQSHPAPTHVGGSHPSAASGAPRGGGESARSAPPPAHVEPSHSSPPPASSSSGTKKP